MHTVSKGETVFSISKLYGITQTELIIANNIHNNQITVGQELIIPGSEGGIVKRDTPTANQSIATRLVLPRFNHTDKYTLGTIGVRQAERWDKESEIFTCKTLELPWRGNEAQKSCIPCGVYPIVFEYSEHFTQNLWEVKQVPNRSEVKIHVSNHVNNLLGCVAVGKEHIDFNKDGVIDVTDSANTLKALHGVLHDQKYLTLEVVNIDSNFDYYKQWIG